MKAERVGKKDANTKTTQQCVIKEETEVSLSIIAFI